MVMVYKFTKFVLKYKIEIWKIKEKGDNNIYNVNNRDILNL